MGLSDLPAWYRALVQNFGIDFSGNKSYAFREDNSISFSTSGKLHPEDIWKHLRGETILLATRFKHSQVQILQFEPLVSNNWSENQFSDLIQNLISQHSSLSPFLVEINTKQRTARWYFRWWPLPPLEALLAFGRSANVAEGVLRFILPGELFELPLSPASNIFLLRDGEYLENGDLRLRQLFSDPPRTTTPDSLSAFQPQAHPIQARRGASSETLRQVLENHRYGCGTRNRAQLAIAAILRSNRASFEDFENWCHELNDGTSKDMLKPEDEVLRLLQGIWVSAGQWHDRLEREGKAYTPVALRTSEKPTEYIQQSYSDLIDDRTMEKAEKIIRWRAPTFIYEKSRERFIQGCLLMLRELLAKRIFRSRQNYHYSAQFSFLEEGIPFGIEEEKMMAKALKLSQPTKLRKFLVEVGLIQEIADESGYHYSYKGTRYVSHYRVGEDLVEARYIELVKEKLDLIGHPAQLDEPLPQRRLSKREILLKLIRERGRLTGPPRPGPIIGPLPAYTSSQ